MKSDTIQLIPVGQPVGPLKWNMSMNGNPPQGPNNYPEVVVAKGDTADLTFTIRNPGAIKFADNDAFCAQAGTAKPTAGKCDTNDFSYTIDSSGNLVVHDKNLSEGTYTYVVNFKFAPQLDPIIKNGGGGGLMTGVEIWYAIGAVGIIALVVIFWRPLMRMLGR
jgi:hypothetical protein